MDRLHFPLDIKLAEPPLAEAWLEIRWRMQPTGIPGQAQDPDFPFALGVFYNAVRDRYTHRQDLPASQIPLFLLPFVVRHQFWSAQSIWPILQLGPGVATVNFTLPYSWASLRSEAVFLRNKLLEAYGSKLAPCESITLRYLNAEPYDFSKDDVLSFLRSNLNTDVHFPQRIPNGFVSNAHPSNGSFQVAFNLITPPGTATIGLATGARDIPARAGPPVNPTNVVMWQLEVASQGEQAPQLSDGPHFEEWLDLAHQVVHEWFFSLIEGKLMTKYKGKES